MSLRPYPLRRLCNARAQVLPFSPLFKKIKRHVWHNNNNKFGWTSSSLEDFISQIFFSLNRSAFTISLGMSNFHKFNLFLHPNHYNPVHARRLWFSHRNVRRIILRTIYAIYSQCFFFCWKVMGIQRILSSDWQRKIYTYCFCSGWLVFVLKTE